MEKAKICYNEWYNAPALTANFIGNVEGYHAPEDGDLRKYIPLNERDCGMVFCLVVWLSYPSGTDRRKEQLCPRGAIIDLEFNSDSLLVVEIAYNCNKQLLLSNPT